MLLLSQTNSLTNSTLSDLYTLVLLYRVRFIVAAAVGCVECVELRLCPSTGKMLLQCGVKHIVQLTFSLCMCVSVLQPRASHANW